MNIGVSEDNLKQEMFGTAVWFLSFIPLMFTHLHHNWMSLTALLIVVVAAGTRKLILTSKWVGFWYAVRIPSIFTFIICFITSLT